MTASDPRRRHPSTWEPDLTLDPARRQVRLAGPANDELAAELALELAPDFIACVELLLGMSRPYQNRTIDQALVIEP